MCSEYYYYTVIIMKDIEKINLFNRTCKIFTLIFHFSTNHDPTMSDQDPINL